MTPKVMTSEIGFRRVSGKTSSSSLNLSADFGQILLMALTDPLQGKEGGEAKISDLSSASILAWALILSEPSLKENGKAPSSQEEENLNPQALLCILQDNSGTSGEGIESPRSFPENVLLQGKGETEKKASLKSHPTLVQNFEEAREVSVTTFVSSKEPEGKALEAFGRVEFYRGWEVFSKRVEKPVLNPLEGEAPPKPLEGEAPPNPLEGEVPPKPLEGKAPPKPLEGERVVVFSNSRKGLEANERAVKDEKLSSEAFREVFSRSSGKFESEGSPPVALGNLRKNYAETSRQNPNPRREILSFQRPLQEGLSQEISDPRVERLANERAPDQGLYPQTETLKTVAPERIFQTTSQREGLRSEFWKGEGVFSSSGAEREGVNNEFQKRESVFLFQGAEKRGLNLDSVSLERIEQMVKDLIYELRPSGEKKASLKLEPPELGEIEIDLKVQEQKIEILFKVERPEVARELYLHLSPLKHSLEQRGLNLSEFQVTFFGSEGGSAYSFWKDEEQQRNPAERAKRDSSEELTLNAGRKEGLLNIVI